MAATSLVTVLVAGPIFLVGLVTAWKHRVVFVGLPFAVLPQRYIRDRRVTTIFWHRAVISIGVNHAWPFGDLRGRYDCTSGGIPDGLVAGAFDQNGPCIGGSVVLLHLLHRAGAQCSAASTTTVGKAHPGLRVEV
jgi:hypothetical protein